MNWNQVLPHYKTISYHGELFLKDHIYWYPPMFSQVRYICISSEVHITTRTRNNSYRKTRKNSGFKKQMLFDRKYFIPMWTMFKFIYPKYSKHWSYLLAASMNYGCSKMLSHGLFISLFKFYGWNYILYWIENSGLNSILLYC